VITNVFGSQFKKSRVSDQIADHIKQAISATELIPGDKLPPENELADQFNVSKVSIREALLKLQGQGLIEKRRGAFGGNYITRPMLSKVGESVWNSLRFGSLNMTQILEFRNILEPTIMKRAVAAHTEEDLAAMRANIEFCEEAAARGKHDKKAQVEFHVLLAHACHNLLISAFMEAVIDVFKAISNDFFNPPETAHAKDLEYSKQFYECLLTRNSEKGYKIMQEHSEWIKQYLVCDED
jgi:GntR family transcriptional repressor for pyruvate dehydrogenase complex